MVAVTARAARRRRRRARFTDVVGDVHAAGLQRSPSAGQHGRPQRMSVRVSVLSQAGAVAGTQVNHIPRDDLAPTA